VVLVSAEGLSAQLLWIYAARDLRLRWTSLPKLDSMQREDVDEMLGNLLDNAMQMGGSAVACNVAGNGSMSFSLMRRTRVLSRRCAM